MAIEGGEDLRDTAYASEAVDEMGRQFDPFTGEYFVGSFPADFSGMQISNPQPGMHYFYAANSASDIIHFANKYGAEVITDDHPERIGMSRIAQISKLNPGGNTAAYGDVVAMRCTEEAYDSYRRRQYEEHKDVLDGVIADFKDRDPMPGGRTTRVSATPRGETRIDIEDLPNR